MEKIEISQIKFKLKKLPKHSLQNSLKSSSRLQPLLWFILGAVFLLNFYPVIWGLILSWVHSDEASHGFFIVPIAFYIVWLKKDKLAQLPISTSWTGLVVTFFSLLLFIVARLAEVQTVISCSMILFLAGTVLFLFGWKILKEISFPLLLLLLMIPVPSQIYSVATIPLQLLVSKVSVFSTSLIGIPVLREGNIITLPGHTMQVVQACSGLRSLTALMTLALIFGYFTLNNNLLRCLLVIAAVPVAIIVNIIRVAVMILTLYYWGLNLTEGGIHKVYGLAIFAFALVLLMIFRRFFLFWDNPKIVK